MGTPAVVKGRRRGSSRGWRVEWPCLACVPRKKSRIRSGIPGPCPAVGSPGETLGGSSFFSFQGYVFICAHAESQAKQKERAKMQMGLTININRYAALFGRAVGS